MKPDERSPMVTCPDCHGSGRIAYQALQGFDGSQAWSTMSCPTCGGSGQVAEEEKEMSKCNGN